MADVPTPELISIRPLGGDGPAVLESDDRAQDVVRVGRRGGGARALLERFGADLRAIAQRSRGQG
jgi:hypothetical protein